MQQASIGEARARVECAVHDAIGWLRIDNAARLNAMTLAMWRELGEGVARLSQDPTVRVIVITGRGGKAFCSGGDISEFGEHRNGPSAMETYDTVGKEALDLLAGTLKPTIALIQGYCIGGGMAIALRCDLRIGADTARMGIPAAKLGLSYDYSSIRLLVDLVGSAGAKQILYTAHNLRAAEALRRGLLCEVVPADEIEDHVRTLAQTIAGNAPLSLRATKLIVGMALSDPADRDLAACKAAELVCLASEDYREATSAFMEKRKPVFKGS